MRFQVYFCRRYMAALPTNWCIMILRVVLLRYFVEKHLPVMSHTSSNGWTFYPFQLPLGKFFSRFFWAGKKSLSLDQNITQVIGRMHARLNTIDGFRNPSGHQLRLVSLSHYVPRFYKSQAVLQDFWTINPYDQPCFGRHFVSPKMSNSSSGYLATRRFGNCLSSFFHGATPGASDVHHHLQKASR